MEEYDLLGLDHNIPSSKLIDKEKKEYDLSVWDFDCTLTKIHLTKTYESYKHKSYQAKLI